MKTDKELIDKICFGLLVMRGCPTASCDHCRNKIESLLEEIEEHEAERSK